MLRRLEAEGEEEVLGAEVAQDQESIPYPESLEVRPQLAIIAIRKVILPESAVSLPKAGEKDHHPKELMAGASSAMKRVTRKLIVQIEEIATEVEGNQAPTQEVFLEEDRDQGLTLEVRKSKLTAHIHHPIPVVDLPRGQGPDLDLQDPDPDQDQTQRRVKVPEDILRVDLPARNRRSTSQRDVIDLRLQKRGLTPETPAVDPNPAAQDQKPKEMEKKPMPPRSPSSKSQRPKENK